MDFNVLQKIMGCEGDANLDNDAAADLLCDISDGLFSRVVELMNHPRGHEYDDEEISELFVRIEMIFALHERGMIYGAPDQNAISLLIDPFIARWKKYHLDAGHDVPAQRLVSMADTFARLVSLIREVHS